MNVFHVIPHTHWDREWHKTFQENRVRLIPFMQHLLDTIANDENFIFTLDGQTSLIEDYLAVKPEAQSRLKEAIETKRLIIGPWYVQPDTFIPSFESLVRNRLISKRIATSYGNEMITGYLPDSFGQASIVPSLLKGFEMPYALIYRGVEETDTPLNTFVWRGIDDQEVLTEWMPKGYGNGMFLSRDIKKTKAIVKDNLDLFDQRLASNHVLFMSGSDQCFAKSHLSDALRTLNQSGSFDPAVFKLTTIDDHMVSVEKSSKTLPLVKGELRKGKYGRVHASIAATRLDIKKTNFELERLYEAILEPLNALQFLYTKEPHIDIIQKGWKYLIENHAHDSICTVCTDNVHKEMNLRYQAAREIAMYLVEEHFKSLHDQIKFETNTGRPVVIFNGTTAAGWVPLRAKVYTKEPDFILKHKDGTPISYDVISQHSLNLKDTKVALMPIPDDYYYETEIIFEAVVEGIGYQTLYVDEREKPVAKLDHSSSVSMIENQYIEVRVNEIGLLDITDKETQCTYRNQLEYLDGGNAGDEYDYSPPQKDELISSKNRLEKVDLIKDTPLEKRLRLTHRLPIPINTTLEKRSDEVEDVLITTEVVLYQHSKFPQFKAYWHNNVKNHRVQVLFSAEKHLENHIADVQLGFLSRENQHQQTKESVLQGWSERYYPTYSAHRLVGFKECLKPFAILNRGLPHYEIMEGKTIAITLLSGVGYMGNENLPYRPGRRSGALCETPDAQMIGFWEAEFAFVPWRNDQTLDHQATLYTNPPLAVSYAEYKEEGSWPDKLTLFKSSSLRSTILKVSESGKHLVIRLNNASNENHKKLKFNFHNNHFCKVESVNLAEEVIEDNLLIKDMVNTPDESNIPLLSGDLVFNHCTHNQFKTLMFTPKL